ncbi:MAG: TPR end-of-group domain-containing protein, partial [Bryobacteraceae bacterium]
LWVRQYERDMRDVLSLQKEVARAVTDEVRVNVTPSEQARLAAARQVDPEVYQLYLKAREQLHLRNEPAVRVGVALFRQILAREPGHALAYTGLADCYNWLGNYAARPPAETFPLAKIEATKALRIDNTIAEAHAALAYALFEYDWDFTGAEKEFRRAIELNPGYSAAHQWYGWFLANMLRPAEALDHLRRAVDLDPLSSERSMALGWFYVLPARQPQQGLEPLRKAIAADPGSFIAYAQLGLAYIQLKRPGEAVKAFETSLSLGGQATWAMAGLGHAFAVQGDRIKAAKVVGELRDRLKREYVSSYDIAVIHAGLGENEEALAWLEKAITQRDSWLAARMSVDPRLDGLRSNPRFRGMLKRIGLPG